MKTFKYLFLIISFVCSISMFAQDANALDAALTEENREQNAEQLAETEACGAEQAKQCCLETAQGVCGNATAQCAQQHKSSVWSDVAEFFGTMGFMRIIKAWRSGILQVIMILVSFFLLYLAIKKQYEPLLLLPIAFGMLLTNLPGAEMFHSELWSAFLDENSPYYHSYGEILKHAGLLDVLYIGVKAGVYPCLIFIGVGAMTDFGPLIANPKSLLLGAAAQVGIFLTFLMANSIGPVLELCGASADLIASWGFSEAQAGSIGIIGGADGPTSIFLTSKLAPELLGPIAIAAYSYMALVPVIQPPIMRALTTKEERAIKMKQLRSVSKTEKIIFPIMITAVVALILPDAAPLIGCLMLGNLMKECGVVDRLSKTAQNELMNIVVIFLGLSVGATATAEAFLNVRTILILLMGILAFACGTGGGVLLAKLMNVFSKDKINPLIGSAGVSAVPMAARVSQQVGQEENPSNFLLMHAMGPNVAGVIGSAVAAGVLLSLLG